MKIFFIKLQFNVNMYYFKLQNYFMSHLLLGSVACSVYDSGPVLVSAALPISEDMKRSSEGTTRSLSKDSLDSNAPYVVKHGTQAV